MTSSVAQTRLNGEEWDSLHETMRILHIDSTSEALREGLRLLRREAVEIAAAEEIEKFYGGKRAPLPDGVVAQISQEELDAADKSRW